MAATDRECPSCGAHVPADRLTDPACWERVPMPMKLEWWRARRSGSVGARIRAAGPVLRWLRDNPPPVKKGRKKAAR